MELNVKKFWKRIFHSEDDCRFFFYGVCLREINDISYNALVVKKNPISYCIGVCDKFEQRKK